MFDNTYDHEKYIMISNFDFVFNHTGINYKIHIINGEWSDYDHVNNLENTFYIGTYNIVYSPNGQHNVCGLPTDCYFINFIHILHFKYLNLLVKNYSILYYDVITLAKKW